MYPVKSEKEMSLKYICNKNFRRYWVKTLEIEGSDSFSLKHIREGKCNYVFKYPFYIWEKWISDCTKNQSSKIQSHRYRVWN